VLTVAYLANQFPSPVEPYVVEEIEELRRRGVRVIAGSVRKPRMNPSANVQREPEIALQPLPLIVFLRAFGLCVCRWKRISVLIARIAFRGKEGPLKRVKALAHTWLGACYAVLLKGHGVDHIHVHHGYFGSWIAMVAARLLGVEFSMTLHGSDLLLHGTYLDVKLENCSFCLTVSEYNRRYILGRYSGVDPARIVVARLGVDVSEFDPLAAPRARASGDPFTVVAVGRLHSVKDHAFLLHACAQLCDFEVPFECLIAGEGPERRNLESLIRQLGLQGRATLLGHVPREQMDSFYDRADLVVLTSRSEGVPLVLMEAMARGKIVLAPAITGIPELVIPGKTGFLYEPGSLDDFLDRLLFIRSRIQALDHPEPRRRIPSTLRQLEWVRHAARMQVQHNFNRSKNLEAFGDLFLQRIAPQTESIADESFVLQQI
jgi:glycosyltransferase involved in cell wall biosynthesis